MIVRRRQVSRIADGIDRGHDGEKPGAGIELALLRHSRGNRQGHDQEGRKHKPVQVDPPLKNQFSTRGVGGVEPFTGCVLWGLCREALIKELAHPALVLLARNGVSIEVPPGGNPPNGLRFPSRLEIALAMHWGNDSVAHAVNDQQRPRSDSGHHIDWPYPFHIDAYTPPRNRRRDRCKRKSRQPDEVLEAALDRAGRIAKTAVIDNRLDARVVGRGQQRRGTAERYPERSDSAAIHIGARGEIVDGRDEVERFQSAQRHRFSTAAAAIPHVISEDRIAGPVQELRVRQHLRLVVAVAVRQYYYGAAYPGEEGGGNHDMGAGLETDLPRIEVRVVCEGGGVMLRGGVNGAPRAD